jgi:ketosteroid isomerase-like protein
MFVWTLSTAHGAPVLQFLLNFGCKNSTGENRSSVFQLGALSMARILFLIAFFSWTLLPHQPSATEGDEKIIALENIWNQAQLNHDAAAMSSMLHTEFVFTDYDGTVMAKPQFLASIRDSSNALTLEVSDDMKLHRFGDTVVVTGATHEKGKLKGKAYEHYGRFTDTWMRQNGEWICIASQLGLLQKP